MKCDSSGKCWKKEETFVSLTSGSLESSSTRLLSLLQTFTNGRIQFQTYNVDYIELTLLESSRISVPHQDWQDIQTNGLTNDLILSLSNETAIGELPRP